MPVIEPKLIWKYIKLANGKIADIETIQEYYVQGNSVVVVTSLRTHTLEFGDNLEACNYLKMLDREIFIDA